MTEATVVYHHNSIILYHTHFLTTGFESLERVTLDLTKEDASAIVLAQCSS